MDLVVNDIMHVRDDQRVAEVIRVIASRREVWHVSACGQYLANNSSNHRESPSLLLKSVVPNDLVPMLKRSLGIRFL